MMLEFTARGIYCPQADAYIDPWKPVDRAIITHAHSDHARPYHKHYLCHRDAAGLLRLRLGPDIDVQAVGFGECIRMNGVTVSLHPAGHIIGSAQVRLEYRGEIAVISGDYKLTNDGISTAFEPITCHHFVTESTFGLPVYRFPDHEDVFNEMSVFWKGNADEGFSTLFIGYSLGKAQRILAGIDRSIVAIFYHGAIANVNEALQEAGYRFPGERITADISRDQLKQAAIVAPMSALGSPWLKRFVPYRIGVCSGWMQLRGARRRSGADRGFILSDHADWEQLNAAVHATGAQHIYVTHGYQAVYAQWLREQYGLDAREVKTLFDAEALDDLAQQITE